MAEQNYFPVEGAAHEMPPYPENFYQTYSAPCLQRPSHDTEPANTLNGMSFNSALTNSFPNAARPLGLPRPRQIQLAGVDFLRQQLIRPPMLDHQALLDSMREQPSSNQQDTTAYQNVNNDTYNSLPLTEQLIDNVLQNFSDEPRGYGYGVNEIGQFQHRGDEYQSQGYSDRAVPQEMIAAGSSYQASCTASPYHHVSPPLSFETNTPSFQMQVASNSSPPNGSSVDDAAGIPTSDASFQPSSTPRVVNSRKMAKPRSRRQSTLSDPVISPTALRRAAAVSSRRRTAPIGRNGLRYPSLAAAMAAVENRTKLDVEEDDWEDMEADPAPHVLRIVSAFSANIVDCPHDITLSGVDEERWNNYQAAHLQKVAVHQRKDEAKTEQAAWMVFGSVIEAHKNGVKGRKKNTEVMKCSDHLNMIIQAITDYAIIRWDLVRHLRIEELVTSTHAAISRKLANWNNNTHKRERDEENAAKATEAGFDYNRVLGSKRKSPGGADQCRKRKQTTDATESPETEESLSANVPAPPPKRRRSVTSQPAAAVTTATTECEKPQAAPKRAQARVTKPVKGASEQQKRDPRKTVVAGPDT